MTSSVQAPALFSPVPRAGEGGAARVQPELAAKETAALTAAAIGLTHAAAARRLGTSARSLRRALATATDRLGAVSAAHAVALAAAAGLLDVRHIRERTLPPWPERPPARAPATSGGPSGGRVTGALQSAARAERFARAVPLFEQGAVLREVAAHVGIAEATARHYRREWRAARG